jgi:hypothetical protein
VAEKPKDQFSAMTDEPSFAHTWRWEDKYEQSEYRFAAWSIGVPWRTTLALV